jgi:phytol kinase
MDRLLAFFRDNIPPWEMVAIGGPIGLLWSFACLYFAGWLKRHRGWKTGYTRKIFHVLIFMSVALCMVTPGFGTPAVCLLGGMASLVVLYAIVRGPGNLFYEAIAREKDAPLQTWYIIVPYFTTVIGGIASTILFGPAAVAGFLVTGIADAVAEPVGTRFGKHRYRVPSFTRVKSYRSFEGSAAVFIASLACVFATVALSPAIGWSPRVWYLAAAIALICAVVEGVSPHGWDNLTLKIAPSCMVASWL